MLEKLIVVRLLKISPLCVQLERSLLCSKSLPVFSSQTSGSPTELHAFTCTARAIW